MNLNELIAHHTQHTPGFAARMGNAGLKPDDIHTPADLTGLPVIRKDDLASLQKEDPPFAGFLSVLPGALKRIFQSPGPIYDPEARVPDYWRWEQALWAAGFKEGDQVLNAFGYHLTPAGAMFEEGLWAVGCAVIPGGVGNLEQQVQLLHDLGVNGYVGLPSYLKALLDKAAELNLTVQLEKAFVTAEPLPPSLRAELNQRGVTVRQGYGTAECGNLGFECEAQEGWHMPEDAIIQVCDINSGQPVPSGETGEIVATLFIPEYALIRFGTGDLSSVNPEPCACGRESLRLAGWQGRVGEAVKVRGMFLHPRQMGDMMQRFPEVSAFQAVIRREGHRDELTLQVALTAGIDPGDLPERLKEAARERLKFRAEVEVVPQEQLPPDAPPINDLRTWE